MRIALDGDVLGRKRTGDESYLSGLLDGLASADNENEYVLYVRNENGTSEQLRSMRNFTVRRLGPPNLAIKIPLAWPLELVRRPVDLLHVQYLAPPICPCKFVVTVHDVSYSVLPAMVDNIKVIKFFRPLVPFTARRAARVIVDAETTKRDLVNIHRIPADKVAVIPLAASRVYHVIDKLAARKEINAKYHTSEDFILYVGTLHRRKNVVTLVRAMGELKRHSTLPHKLVIVGSKNYDYSNLVETITQLGLEQEVIFTGFVPNEDLVKFYNAASVFVFPSVFEGFGIPPLEAMACGVPVVASNATSIPEVVGNAAVICDPLDYRSMARGIHEVLTNKQLAEQKVKQGFERMKMFTWEKTAALTRQVYEDVYHEGPVKPGSK